MFSKLTNQEEILKKIGQIQELTRMTEITETEIEEDLISQDHATNLKKKAEEAEIIKVALIKTNLEG